MTVSAGSRDVPPLQREIRLTVIQLRQTIETIMALKAQRAKLLSMLLHISCIMRSMTLSAVLRVWRKLRIGFIVTGNAEHRRSSVIHLVIDQAEARLRMIESGQSSSRWRKFQAAMIRMTVHAALAGIDLAM